MQKTEIRCIQFLISRKDTAKMLDFVDETFHQMPLAIEPSIVFSLLFGTRMRWDHHFYASVKQAVHKFLRGIAPIRDNSLKGKAYFDALADVVDLGNLAIPLHIRNAPTQLMRELGYGQGYQAYTDESLLPEEIKGKRYFRNDAE